jgi:hypothetical protein
MRVRVLFTDGIVTEDLLWLLHDGKDVYCGETNSSFKWTYHASGKVHTKENGAELSGEWRAPLVNLQGYFSLGSFGFRSSKAWFSTPSARGDRRYRGGKSDATIVIDSRTIPDGQFVSVHLLLVEPGELASLKPLLESSSSWVMQVQPHQLLLATSVKPWVGVLLYLTTPTEAAETSL